MQLVKSKNLVGSVLLTLAASIWGGMFVVVKSIVNEIPPIELVWLRYATAVLCLLIFSLFMKSRWKYDAHDLKLIIVIGILGNTLSLVTQETGTWLSNAQTGAVITTSTPIFMIIFAWLVLHQRLTWARLGAVIMAALGVITIVGINTGGAHLLLGILSLLVSSCAWALASILLKRLHGTYNTAQITLISSFVAVVMLLPWIFTHTGTMASIHFTSLKTIFCILYLGCISTASAFMMWDKGVELLGADNSGMFYLIQPIVGAILGWLILGESISAGFLIGAALIIGSVYVYLRE
ncbi:MAG: DMT family transporter [Acetilactobacillus jinshanensis]